MSTMYSTHDVPSSICLYDLAGAFPSDLRSCQKVSAAVSYYTAEAVASSLLGSHGRSNCCCLLSVVYTTAVPWGGHRRTLTLSEQRAIARTIVSPHVPPPHPTPVLSKRVGILSARSYVQYSSSSCELLLAHVIGHATCCCRCSIQSHHVSSVEFPVVWTPLVLG